MSDRRKKKSGVFVWLVMALLVLGLLGFGLTGAFRTSGGSTVARVGDQEISADRYLSGLQQDINRASQQFGETISITQAQLLGIDQQSLRRQVTLAALANEARRLNLSVGDAAVRDALLAMPAFQVGGGVFSEATYDLVLKQQRLSRAEFESLLRQDQTQNILSGAISGAVGPQTTAARVLMDYIGETRALTWAEITPDILPDKIDTVDAETARAYYDAHPDEFTIPETRKATYAVITPEILAKGIEVPEADIRALFDTRKETLNTPARRIADRIIFASMEDATAAMARISAGEASFEEIAAERGLSLDEANIGIVRANQLSKAAAALVFGTEETGIYGPVEATLGPAIFRVNAALPANIVPYEDVKGQLRDEIALERAQSQLLGKLDDLENLLASGASIEEMANETDMELRTLELNANSKEETPLDTPLFAEARAAAVGEERDLVEGPDGGVFVVRVDDIVPPRLQPFEEVSEQATAAATAAANLEKARAYAEELKAQVGAGADLTATIGTLGATAHQEAKVTRTSPPANLPPETGLALFGLKEGEVANFESQNGAYIVRINQVSAFDPETADGKNFLAQAEKQIKGDIANDIYIMFANGIVANTDITINQGMIDQILASIPQ